MSEHCRCYSREHSSCPICSPERNRILSNERRVKEAKKREERMFNVKIMLKNIVGEDSHLFKVSPETKVSDLLIDIKTKYPERFKNHKLVLRVKKRRYSNYPLKSSDSKWKLDKYYDSCHKCHINFSMTKRKHHCRSCGLIFCNDCCSHNHKYLNGENGRTCNDCLDLLVNYPMLCEHKDMKFYNLRDGDEIYVLSDIRASMKKKKSKKKRKSKKKKKSKKKFLK
tara:strand:+ start:950 stop:1624 length:675 start_codon:yes stop_codon:yes gene_type:complete